jgi:4-carboxymuconolactone decarboxylase
MGSQPREEAAMANDRQHTDPLTDPDGAHFARGDALRRRVLGDAHVDRSHAHADDFTRDLQELVTRYAWGGVWSRPGLSLRERSIVTLTVLAALVRTEELPLHVRGALNNGLTPQEVKEVLLQTAVYAGLPTANTAFGIARRVVEEVAREGTDARPVDEADAGHA